MDWLRPVRDCTGAGCELIAPRQEDASRTAVGKRRQWEVAKLFLDALDHRGVTATGTIGKAGEIVARLELLQDADQGALRRHHLACHRFIITRDKLRRAKLAAKWRPPFQAYQ